MTGPVVVVGAGAAGLTVVESLRREGFDGPLSLVGDEPHLPYDRPPLSKGVLLGEIEASRLALRDPAVIEALDADLKLTHRAVGVDMARRAVLFSDGSALGFGTLIIATGVRPRYPAGVRPGTTVHTVRTIDDTLALAEALVGADSAIVIGGGLLGYELAATTRTLGLEVTLVDRGARPLARQLGPDVGGMLAALHTERGVRIRGSATVSRIMSHGDGVEVVHGDSTLRASVVIAAVGSVPNTQWLEGSGLIVEDGVACDRNGRAAAGVYAVGDVARWVDGRSDSARIEHRTNATDQAIAVAQMIVHGVRQPRPPRYFWSDQFHVKVQVAGVVGSTSTIEVVEGDPADGRFVALAQSVAGSGVIGWRMPREFARHRTASARPELTV